MQRLDRILLLRLLAIFALILTVVTLSAVLSQAARLTDEVLRAGMSLSEFGGLILLIVPKMAELVTPLAFGIAVILACVQRNEAGTTLLLRAAGRAPRVDASVITGGSLVVALLLFACASVLVPLNQSQYRQAFALAQQQGIERLRIPPGQPVTLVPGLSLHSSGTARPGCSRASPWSTLPAPASSPDHSRRARRTEPSQRAGAFSGTDRGAGATNHGRWADNLASFCQHRASPHPARSARAGRAHAQRPADAAAFDGTAGRSAQATPHPLLAAELTRRGAAALSVLAFGLLASGLLFARRPDGRRQTLPATALLVFLILYLLIQTTLLSARGFSPAPGRWCWQSACPRLSSHRFCRP